MPGRMHWGGLARISNRYWKALISLQRHSRKQVAWTDRFLECRCSESRVSYFELPDRDPHYAAHDAFRCHVTVMSGLPGAGKGTWIANNRPDHPVVSFDLIREELGVAATDNRGKSFRQPMDERGNISGRIQILSGTRQTSRGRTVQRYCGSFGTMARILRSPMSRWVTNSSTGRTEAGRMRFQIPSSTIWLKS